MISLQDIPSLRKWQSEREGLHPLGFVPTMGALHEGHMALVRRAREECRTVVVSIFINPTQFNDPDDCAKYPRTLEADLQRCRDSGVDAVFLPTKDILYPDGYRYRVTENEESLPFEGASRPGHFDGVLTVVLKLFQAVRADRAYFGEKDWQQLALVSGMSQAFFLDTKVIPCPTVREADGLAMSSRNIRLSPTGRAFAAGFPRILLSHQDPLEARGALEAEGFQVDYVEDTSDRRLGAVFVEGVRLIDNFPLPLPGMEYLKGGAQT